MHACAASPCLTAGMGGPVNDDDNMRCNLLSDCWVPCYSQVMCPCSPPPPATPSAMWPWTQPGGWCASGTMPPSPSGDTTTRAGLRILGKRKLGGGCTRAHALIVCQHPLLCHTCMSASCHYICKHALSIPFSVHTCLVYVREGTSHGYQ